MNTSSLLGLIQNGALLLAVAFIFDLFASGTNGAVPATMMCRSPHLSLQLIKTTIKAWGSRQ